MLDSRRTAPAQSRIRGSGDALSAAKERKTIEAGVSEYGKINL